jgi:hypothetical protein
MAFLTHFLSMEAAPWSVNGYSCGADRLRTDPATRGGVSSGLQDFETSPSADGVQFDRCGVTDGSGRINAGLLTART